MYSIDCKLSKIIIALRASEICINLRNLYPLYHKLIEKKNKYYPKNITVTVTFPKVPLPDPVDHTVSRTFRHQSEVLNNDDLHLEITFKWGADGSVSQKNFNQSFEAADLGNF